MTLFRAVSDLSPLSLSVKAFNSRLYFVHDCVRYGFLNTWFDVPIQIEITLHTAFMTLTLHMVLVESAERLPSYNHIYYVSLKRHETLFEKYISKTFSMKLELKRFGVCCMNFSKKKEILMCINAV